MCGIIGCISDRISIDRFNSSMDFLSHRGPNNSGIKQFSSRNRNIVFGHKRLSIIDLSDSGNQPYISDNENFVLIFNGEIYNYKELRNELSLKGVDFKTLTDTEVLLNAWIFWGDKCISKLVGMFSFVIYNKNEGSIYCVKDPYGIKPLYYSIVDNDIYFASELSALKNLIPETIVFNQKAVYSFLINSKYDIGEDTFFQSLKSLAPGSYLKILIGESLVFKRYKWYNPDISLNSTLSFIDAVDELRETFLESLKLHLRSDVPFGVTLSGGIDSSAIACGIRHLDASIPINTFSFVARGSNLNEEKWIDIVNSKINAIPHKVELINNESLIEGIDNLILTQGEPFSTSSIYAQYKVFESVKQSNIVVTLDGQGGDEVLCGYDGYPREIFNSLLDEKEYLGAMKYLYKYNNFNDLKLNIPLEFVRSYLPLNIFNLMKDFIRFGNGKSWINYDNISFGLNGVSYNKFMPKRHLSSALSQELTYTRIPRLLRYSDRNSMNFSVESRVPFLNPSLVNLMLRMPEKFMVSSTGSGKNLFKYAMRDIIPDQIINRQDKIGFEAPENNILRFLASEGKLDFEGLVFFDFINIDKLKSYVDNKIKHNIYDNEIWRMFILSKWAMKNF